MTTNLYSVTRFQSTGSATVHDTPSLLYGGLIEHFLIQALPDNGWGPGDLEKIGNLAEGESTVLAKRMDRMMIAEGFRIRRLPDYRQNRVVFDSHAKEHVLLSNGRCTLPHEDSESFRIFHANGTGSCLFAPSEAIALRPIVDNGKVLLAWTYRAVNPCNLEPVEESREAAIRAEFEAVLSKRRSSRFIGRI